MARMLTTAFVIAAAVGVTGSAQNSSAVGEPQKFLRMVARFTEGDLTTLERGEPVARVLDTDKREVAVVGAVHINAPRERLFDRYRDISSLRGSDVVMEVGCFGLPPSPDDLRSLHFENYDLETIKACKPGDCGVRLSTEDMDQFAREVNWRAPDWRQQAAGLWRQLLAKDAADYLASGKLSDYRNKPMPLNVADEFSVLYAASSYFEPVSPEFFAYVKKFPQVRLPGVENILYWSKDDIYRPVTRMTHLILYPPVAEVQRPGIIATKQFYAAHYFDAGLGFTFTFNDRGSGFYMLSVNRVRTRSLGGIMRAMVRSVVQRRSRDAMQGILRSTKAGLEKARAEATSTPGESCPRR
jgi:hypothetical protein